MDAISNQAKELVASRGGANQSAVKILEEMNLAITVINDIFNDFQQGVTFYGNLNFHLNTLQKVVTDFCLAREIEKSALLQELQAQKNYSNMNAQQPFFKEQDMKFNQGSSVFVPQGNFPQGGNQPQMQGPPQHQQQQQHNQYTATQMFNPQQQHQPQNQGYVQSQMYPMPPNQGGPTQTQAFYPNQGQNQGQTHTQMYNPNQGGQQQYNPNQGFNNNNVASQMGYVPMQQPGTGQFGQFGNVVESTFVPSNPGNNPYFNQGKPPGQR